MDDTASTPDFTAQQLSVRRANEQATALLETQAEVVDLWCECGRQECDARLSVRRGIYRSIRLHGAWFFLANGHERETDTVVHRTKAFVIVGSARESAPRLPFDEV